MSASREKQSRKDLSGSGWVDPKSIQEESQRKESKKSDTLYVVVGILFAIALVISIVWRSGVVAKYANAVTIDGEKYTAADISFYYQNAFSNFYNNYSFFVSYMGLDTSSSLKTQTLNDTAASLLGTTAGQTWHDYFLEQAVTQMISVQNALSAAQAEGYTFSDSVQAQYDDSMASLEESAAAAGLSVSKYLKTYVSSQMTESLYGEHLLRSLQYDDYIGNYYENLTYSDSEVQAVYDEDPNSYDLVSYQAVSISGAAESTTDEEGNTVEPTEEESTAALEAAEAAADQVYADYLAGESLEDLANADESYNYVDLSDVEHTGDVLTEWLFDEARVEGDSAILLSDTTYYVVEFRSRFINESPTVDVRHILVEMEEGTLTSEEEGYEDEQTQLMADAVAKAEELLAQWEAGEATEESFAALASAESTDGGSKYNGGLYTSVTEGEMVDTFNDWCFDASRQTGDTGIVETTYGAHVMYFVQESVPVWKLNATNVLKDADYSAWLETFSSSTVESSNFGLNFVG